MLGCVEVDLVADPEAAARLDADPALAVADLDRARHAQHVPRRRLLVDPGGANQEHEGRRAAVHARNLRTVDFDAEVVHAEPVGGGQQMLDRVERHVAAAKRRRQMRLARERRRRGRDLDRARQIRPDEHDARAGARRVQRELHRFAGVQPDAGT